MPLIVSQPYKVISAVASSYELLLVDATGGVINNTLYGIDPSKNQFTLRTAPPLSDSIKQVEYSPNGNFMAVTYRYAPFLSLFHRGADGHYAEVPIDYGTFSAIVEPATARPLSFTADSSKMFCIDKQNAVLRTFNLKADGSTYQQTASYQMGGYGSGGCVSPDGNYFAFSSESSQGIYLLKWNGTNFAYITAGSYGNSSLSAPEWLTWDKNGEYVFATTTNASYSIFWWKRTGDTIARVNSIGVSGGLRRFTLSPDNQYFVSTGGAANSPSTYLVAFKWNGSNSLSKLTIPQPQATGSALSGVAFSPDGLYLAVSGQNIGTQKNQAQLYQRLGDSFSALPNYLQTNTSFGAVPYFLPI